MSDANHRGITAQLMPLVSIVLPTCARPTLLSRAIPSVLAQTERDWELLVVDNAAPGALDALGHMPRDPRLKVVRAPEARNASGARNAGLDAARGTWITFLDDDDAYRSDKVARQLALATAAQSPLALCGARFHLRGRTRLRHVGTAAVSGDALLNCAGFGTPFLFHRQCGHRFDETLFAGEDYHYAHGLLAEFGVNTVPVVAEPLVDVYQDAPAIARTNLQAVAGWRAARRIWWDFGRRYSRGARRLFVARALVARAKLEGDTNRVVAWVPALLRAGGLREWRFALNALLVSRRWGRGRWVT